MTLTDEQIVAAYKKHGNVWKVAEELGGVGQTVHRRLKRLGVDTSMNRFSDADRERLRCDYAIYRDAGKLADLAASMGRTKTFLCTQARKLGLTDKHAPKRYAGSWKHMHGDTAATIWDDFKRSSLGLGAYCKAKGYDEVGFWRTMRDWFGDEYEHVIEAKAPKQSMYRLGRAFEYRVRDHLRKLGFFVLRAPQSRSPTDLVAIRRGEVLFVQCKRSGQLGVGEWNELYDLSESVGATPIMAEMPGPRGIVMHRLTSRKDGSKRRQPMESFAPTGAVKL